MDCEKEFTAKDFREALDEVFKPISPTIDDHLLRRLEMVGDCIFDDPAIKKDMTILLRQIITQTLGHPDLFFGVSLSFGVLIGITLMRRKAELTELEKIV